MHISYSPWLVRLPRTGLARWLAVIVLSPLMVLGSFGGRQFLAHGHDEHGTHLHPVHGLHGSALAAADHADHHDRQYSGSPLEVSVDGDDECGLAEEVPEGIIVSLTDHKQLPTRGVDLGKILSPATAFMLAVFAMPPPPDPDRHIGSPGGLPGGGPLDLRALSASDRLVRTSRALLI